MADRQWMADAAGVAEVLGSGRPFAALATTPPPDPEPFHPPSDEWAVRDWLERRAASAARFMNRQQNAMAYTEAAIALDTHRRKCRRLCVW